MGVVGGVVRVGAGCGGGCGQKGGDVGVWGGRGGGVITCPVCEKIDV